MASQRKMLVTAALPYANGPLHLGHMVGYIEADIWVRLQKMQGHDCLYICGSDGHGTPIMIQAEKMGLTPEAMITEIGRSQERDFADFHVDFDHYGSTHSSENKILVEMLFERHRAKGNIHKKIIKQLFDPIKQLFLPDRYIKGECPRCHSQDQYGDNCEICGATYLPTELIHPYSTLSGAKPIEKASEHYFFKLNQFESFLKEWTHANHLQTEVKHKLDEWFKVGLQEWDISRDAPYFGFLIPGEKDKYFYVWLDAPIGYMASFQNLCDKRKDIHFSAYWGKESQAELYHFIGKDIVNFHALFWPALLEGADFRTPTKIFVNGYLTVDGQKMSKSRGTFVKARTYLNHLKPEYLRYYFAAKLSDKIEDLDINFDDFMLRINADLVGKFINIASRSASFITKYFNGTLSAICAEPLLIQQFSDAGKQIADKWERLQFSQAIRQIMELADRANQYIDEKKPWALIKNPDQHETVQAICSMGIHLFRILMIYLKPVLPYTAIQVESFLNVKPLQWSDKDHLLLDHRINEFKPLIQRIDLTQIEALKMAAKEDIQDSTQVKVVKTNLEKNEKSEKTEISIDDFNKIDLRVAKIIHAEAIEGADKLLRLQVELTEGEKRQVFAGIKSAYQPEQLMGRHVVMVANLAPRKMRFGVSEGMILAAGGKDELWLISPDEGAEPGFKVK